MQQRERRKRAKIWREQEAEAYRKKSERYAEARSKCRKLEQENETLRMQVNQLKTMVDVLTRMMSDQLPKNPNSVPVPESYQFANYVQQANGGWKRLTGYEWDEIQGLHAELSPLIESFTSDAKPRIYNTTKPPKYGTMFCLLATLVFLYSHPPLIALECLFCTHWRTLKKCISRVLRSCGPKLKLEVTWPTDQEAEELRRDLLQMTPPCAPEAILVIDGTEWKCKRSSKTERETAQYSVKKKQHSNNVQVICQLNGVIRFYSHVFIGANDQRDWNALQLRNKFIGKSYGIIGDGGYYFNRATDDVEIHGVKPIRQRRRGDGLTISESRWNKQISSARVVVENVMARLKTWNIIGGKYNLDSWGEDEFITQDDILDFVVPLENRKIKKTPLRGPDYVHPYRERPRWDFEEQ